MPFRFAEPYTVREHTLLRLRGPNGPPKWGLDLFNEVRVLAPPARAHLHHPVRLIRPSRWERAKLQP